MNRWELLLARRLAWKAEGRRRVSPAVAVAVTGVALSIVVMLLAVAIVLGFKREVTQRIFDANDAIVIRAYSLDGEAATFDAATILGALTLPTAATPVERLEVQGILKTPQDFLGINLQGRADITADTAIVISPSIASKLALQVGDKIPAYFVLNERIRARALTVTDIYSSSLPEHDALVAYCSPTLPRTLLAIPQGQVQSLGIRNIAPGEVDATAQQIHDDLLRAYYAGQISGAYTVETIFQANAALFSWLSLLDTNVVVILVLMALVAAFTLISSLFIIILERVRTIGLLKAMGAANGQVRSIFRLMAARLLLRGMLIGNAVAIAIIVLQNFTHILHLDPESYFVDFVPMHFSWAGFLALNLAVLALSWLVLMLPAMIIARISPATTIRYE